MPAQQTHLSPEQRGYVLALHDEHYTYREIAEKTGIPRSTAQRTVDRYKKHGTCHDLPRSGRPRIFDSRQERRILRELRNNRFTPYPAIAASLGNLTAHQVRNVATSAGYHRRVARRKPFLSRSAIKARIRWVKDNRKRDWTKVIWTDESSIETGEHPGQQHVTRLPGEQFVHECIAPTFRSGRKTIMVWACITHNTKGPIIRINTVPEKTDENGKKKGGGLNGKRYVEQIISGPLKNFWLAEEEAHGPGMLVVEDGAPCHRSKVAKKARAEVGYPTLNHPATSPDLNPIEPLWLILKNRVAMVPGSANSLDALWASVQQVWDEITVEEIQMHTGKMHERVAAVQDAEGWHTRF